MRDEPTFRHATRDDLPAVVALLTDDAIAIARDAEHTAGADDYRRAYDEIERDPRNHLIVADIGGEVVGTLQLTYIPGLGRKGAERAQIESVRVASGRRGSGIGRAMVGWAVDRAREHGCRLVQLTSDRRRSDAIRFYESLGFEPTHVGLKLGI